MGLKRALMLLAPAKTRRPRHKPCLSGSSERTTPVILIRSIPSGSVSRVTPFPSLASKRSRSLRCRRSHGAGPGEASETRVFRAPVRLWGRDLVVDEGERLDWHWILERQSDGQWKVRDWGY